MVMIPGIEDESFRVLSGRADAGLIVLCDHASNAMPPEYGTLGLPASELERHIAYDIGAEGVTRVIAEAFGAPAVLSRFSRLLIDPNRGADDPTLIMRLSDGAIVPGNRHVDAAERTRRVERFYNPYHRAIEYVIAECMASGVVPAILSIHSFTEAWKGTPRPWHAGILWDRDPRLARPLISALSALPGLVVGDNQPYKGALQGDCMWQHATARGLVHALVEVRQDLIRSVAGQIEWGERLVAVVDSLRGHPDLSIVPARSGKRSGAGPISSRRDATTPETSLSQGAACATVTRQPHRVADVPVMAHKGDAT
ncbi:MAG TPA: N-formylglutamate amidohydrolase [Hyphomicrobiaceae bacterium]|nr:N-formylglutamate amidohydrolase [Hyphomicrobiaceae bacterium]